MFLGVNSVFATSGACSWHLGVNCSAGMNSSTGDAICNDGTDSSVLYVNMDECMNNLQCTPAEYQSLIQIDGVTAAQSQLQSDQQQEQTLNTEIANINNEISKKTTKYSKKYL